MNWAPADSSPVSFLAFSDLLVDRDQLLLYSFVALDHFPWLFFAGAFLIILLGRIDLGERFKEAAYGFGSTLAQLSLFRIQLPKMGRWTLRTRLKRRQRTTHRRQR